MHSIRKPYLNWRYGMRLCEKQCLTTTFLLRAIFSGFCFLNNFGSRHKPRCIESKYLSIVLDSKSLGIYSCQPHTGVFSMSWGDLVPRSNGSQIMGALSVEEMASATIVDPPLAKASM